MMINFGSRLLRGVIGAIIQAPFIAVGSALFGYTYAKLADLPAPQLALAWVIWNVAEGTILAIACSFSENCSFQNLIRCTIMTGMTIIGMQEMQKRGLIGENMLMCITILRILTVTQLLFYESRNLVKTILNE